MFNFSNNGCLSGSPRYRRNCVTLLSQIFIARCNRILNIKTATDTHIIKRIQVRRICYATSGQQFVNRSRQCLYDNNDRYITHNNFCTGCNVQTRQRNIGGRSGIAICIRRCVMIDNILHRTVIGYKTACFAFLSLKGENILGVIRLNFTENNGFVQYRCHRCRFQQANLREMRYCKLKGSKFRNSSEEGGNGAIVFNNESKHFIAVPTLRNRNGHISMTGVVTFVRFWGYVIGNGPIDIIRRRLLCFGHNQISKQRIIGRNRDTIIRDNVRRLAICGPGDQQRVRGNTLPVFLFINICIVLEHPGICLQLCRQFIAIRRRNLQPQGVAFLVPMAIFNHQHQISGNVGRNQFLAILHIHCRIVRNHKVGPILKI